jgi:hypothetical protein
MDLLVVIVIAPAITSLVLAMTFGAHNPIRLS